MLPAIFLSSISAVLTEVLGCRENYKFILACISCIVTFLLSVVQYLKLDAAAEAHRASAHQYDKLQSDIEFCSGALLLFKKIPGHMNISTDKEDINKSMRDELGNILSHVATAIKEIKNQNTHCPPNIIRRKYPVIYNINIFTFIKKIKDSNLNLITQLKNVKNEIRFIDKLQQKQHRRGIQMTAEYKFQIMKLFEQKKYLINELLLLKSAFSVIEQVFIREIDNAEIIKNSYFGCGFCVSQKLLSHEEYNKPRCCCKKLYNLFCCNIEVIDPVKLNTFVANLLDPYNDTIHNNKPDNVTHLETLWFKANQSEWLKKRQSNDYWQRAMADQ
tara:strand:- start:74 stop:1066 length:993 start_codon:yes stop_codon:yes gene_type:complete